MEYITNGVDYAPKPVGFTNNGRWSIVTEIPNDYIIKQLTLELEKHYDSKARERRYDNRLTCALRAGYAGPFQAEGTAFAIWMDSCNAYAYQVMADVLNGLRGIPTAQELIAELPSFTW